MNPELRTNLRRNVIEALFNFASPDVQRLWVTGHPTVVIDFTETICGWFDDIFGVVGIWDAVESGWLSEEEAEAIEEFNDVAGTYTEPPSRLDADVLRDPRWSEVVRHGQTAWRALQRAITDPTELQLMDELESTWGALPR